MFGWKAIHAHGEYLNMQYIYTTKYAITRSDVTQMIKMNSVLSRKSYWQFFFVGDGWRDCSILILLSYE